MANTQALANSFKAEALRGIHALGTSVVRAGTGADVLKLALFLTSATLSASTTAYSTTGEVTGTGYTAGGVVVPNATAPLLSGSTGIWTPSAVIDFGTVTLATAFDCALLYNVTQGGKAIAVFTFAPTTVSAGPFQLTLPASDAANALVRIA